MIEKQKISLRQAFYFIFTTAFGTIAYMPATVLQLSGRAGGIIEIMSIFLLVPLALWTLWLGQKAPGHTILEILETVAGKIVGKVVGGIYTLFFLTIGALFLRMTTGMLQEFTLQFTPVWVTMFVILTLAITIAYSGIEVLGRLGEVLQVVLLVIYYVILTPWVLIQLQPEYFSPLFDRNIQDYVKCAYFAASNTIWPNMFLLVMVAAIPSPAISYWAITKAFLFAAVFLGLAAIPVIGMFGAEEGSRMAFGGLDVALNLGMGNFIQGLEVFLQIAYILITILGVAAYLYGSWVAAVQVFNNQFSRTLLAITAISVGAMVLSIHSYTEAYIFAIRLGYITLPFVVFILLLTTIFLFLRGRKVAKNVK